MLRKLLIVGVCAGASASIPALYESNPAAFERLLKPDVPESAPEPSSRIALNTVAPSQEPEYLPGRKVRMPADERGHFSGEFKLNGRSVDALIDTGATLVAINLSTARRIGISSRRPSDAAMATSLACKASENPESKAPFSMNWRAMFCVVLFLPVDASRTSTRTSRSMPNAAATWMASEVAMSAAGCLAEQPVRWKVCP